jgi:ribokinase
MRVLVIGSTTVDVLVRDAAGLPDYGGDEFTVANLQVLDHPPSMRMGGNGGNAAAVLGALGREVTLCTNLGGDEWGAWARGQLTARGVEVVTPPGLAASSVHIAITDRAHRRRSLYHPSVVPGADRDLLAAAGAVLVCGHPHPSIEQVRTIAALARGAVTLFDIGPNLGQGYTSARLAPCLGELGWLVANEAELHDLDGGDPLATARELAGRCHAGVVLKRGARGAALLGRDGGGWQVPAFPVPVSTTIGAGDAFNAGLVYAMTAGSELPEALRTAAATAALAVSSPAGALGVPDAAAVEEFLRAREGQAPVTPLEPTLPDPSTPGLTTPSRPPAD